MKNTTRVIERHLAKKIASKNTQQRHYKYHHLSLVSTAPIGQTPLLQGILFFVFDVFLINKTITHLCIL